MKKSEKALKYEPLLDNNSGRIPLNHVSTKYTKLENEIHSPNKRFLSNTMQLQNEMMNEQDEQLDKIGESISTLKTVSNQINTELDDQVVMLDEFGNDLETTDLKLDATMKKMAKVLRMNNDRRQWMAIGILTAILIFLIILFIIT